MKRLWLISLFVFLVTVIGIAQSPPKIDPIPVSPESQAELQLALENLNLAQEHWNTVQYKAFAEVGKSTKEWRLFQQPDGKFAFVPMPKPTPPK